MSSISHNENREVDRRLLQGAYWLPYFFLGIWLVALWASGQNRNLLFLIFNFALFTSLGGFFYDIRAKSALFLLGALLPLAQVDYVPPNRLHVSNRLSTVVPVGHSFNVVFTLYNWEEFQQKCDIRNLEVILWARDYRNIDFYFGSTQIESSSTWGETLVEEDTGRIVARIQYALDLSDLSEEIVIRVQSKNGTDAIEIMKGPEAHGKKLYSSAVYLSATGSRCRVIYHSSHAMLRRRSALAQSQGSSREEALP